MVTTSSCIESWKCVQIHVLLALVVGRGRCGCCTNGLFDFVFVF